MFSPRDFAFHFLDGFVETWRYGAGIVPRADLFQPAAKDLAGGGLVFDVGGQGTSTPGSRAVPFTRARNICTKAVAVLMCRMSRLGQALRRWFQ